MIKKITWNVGKKDGTYIGQSSAFAADTAFVKCMFVRGIRVVRGEYETDSLNAPTVRIIYNSEEFLIDPQTGA